MSRSYVERFSAAEHDLGPRPLGELAEHCYVIAATPRSGSNLLGDALRTSGDLGVPMEYLDEHVAEATLRERWGAGDLAEYIAHLHARRTSRTGWFGLKLHWHQAQAFFERLDGRSWTPDRYGELRVVIESLFPGTRWIRVRRHDVVGAAVSAYRASTTGLTVAFDGVDAAVEEPPLDDAALHRMREFAAGLRASDTAWDEFAAVSGVVAHEVTFEGLVADVAGTVEGVRAFLGVGPGEPARPTTTRQSDDWSARARELLERSLAAGPIG